MLPELDIRGGVRRCVRTDRVLRGSDHYFSLLREEKGCLVRKDFAAEQWEGPPADAFAWWESEPDPNNKGQKAAPNEVLLRLFDQWAEDPQQAEDRFVLALLLVRRRVFRLEPTVTLPATEEPAQPLLRVYCPRRDETYDVPEHAPDSDRAARIQERLSQLLAA